MSDSEKIDDSSRNLHPLSLPFEIASILRANVIPTVAAILSTSRGGWIGASIGIVILGVYLTVAIVRYVTFRYRMNAEELVVDSGLIFRVHRTIPLSRIQNMDVSQNIFHRLFRVGELRVETASGSEPEAIFRVVAMKEYGRLQVNLLLSRTKAKMEEAASTPILETEVAAEASAKQLVLVLPTKLILLAGFLSNRGEVVAGLIIGFLWQVRFGDSWIPTVVSGKRSLRKENPANAVLEIGQGIRGYADYLRDQFGSLASLFVFALAMVLLFLLLRTFSAIWYLTRFYGYRLELADGSLYVRCGLFTQVSAVVPLGRIQFISLQQKWLARRFGLASIRIETAGGGGKEKEDAASTIGRKWFVPIVKHSEAGRLLAMIDGRLEGLSESVQWQPQSPGTKSRMFRKMLLVAIAVSIAIAFWSIPLGLASGVAIALVGWFYIGKKAKSRRYGRTAWGLVYKSGMMEQKYSMTFYEKLQSVAVSQSPFDRRWNMSVLSVDTAASGPANHRIEVAYLDTDVARAEMQAIRSKLTL